MCKQARWTIQRDGCKFGGAVSNRIVTRTSTAGTTLDKYLRRGPSGISGVSAVAVESFDTLIGAFTLVLPVYRSASLHAAIRFSGQRANAYIRRKTAPRVSCQSLIQ